MTAKKNTNNQPILSMTGFANSETRFPAGLLLIELRAVNHRYLELNVKIEDSLRQFEPLVREQLQTRLGRGKVECRMSLKSDSASANKLALNPTMVAQIAHTLKDLNQHFPQAQPVNLVDIFKLPGVLQTEAVDTEAMAESLQSGLSQAIEELIAARQREGEKLKQVLLDRLQGVREQISIVKPLLPQVIQQYQEKLTAKLREAMQADDDRVRQEIVLYAQRTDVDEELARLNSHISEMDRILTVGGAVGKKLDFLMQEMNREANTLGSKSVAIETTQVSMQLKVLIEQMREQIQNIE
ncbi:MAG TPA: YicC/YloC family endoribonuclease [Methylophilus sp.]|nr:YicC/YloC family endoribonuclease [Methylophilus sp.]